MSATLAYQKIQHRLRRRIERDWQPGTRLPAMPELAQMLDAGQTNTHRAVKALVAEGKLVARRGAGTYVAPMDLPRIAAVHVDAPPLAGKTISVCPSVMRPGPMVTAMASAFIAAVEAAGARIEFRPLSLKSVKGRLPEDTDAVVVFNPDHSLAIRFSPRQIATIISTSNDLTVLAAGRYDVVGVNQEQGGYLAGELARRHGCRHPCFLGVGPKGGDQLDRTSTSRLRGFEQGFEQSVARANLLRGWAYGPLNGANGVDQFLAIVPRPDVVFCASDELAIGFARGASTHGLEVGRDFRLIGFDRLQLGHELRDAQLTTIEVPVVEMGRRAVDMLISRFNQPDQPVRKLSLGCALALGIT